MPDLTSEHLFYPVDAWSNKWTPVLSSGCLIQQVNTHFILRLPDRRNRYRYLFYSVDAHFILRLPDPRNVLFSGCLIQQLQVNTYLIQWKPAPLKWTHHWRMHKPDNMRSKKQKFAVTRGRMSAAGSKMRDLYAIPSYYIMLPRSAFQRSQSGVITCRALADVPHASWCVSSKCGGRESSRHNARTWKAARQCGSSDGPLNWTTGWRPCDRSHTRTVSRQCGSACGAWAACSCWKSCRSWRTAALSPSSVHRCVFCDALPESQTACSGRRRSHRCRAVPWCVCGDGVWGEWTPRRRRHTGSTCRAWCRSGDDDARTGCSPLEMSCRTGHRKMASRLKQWER